MKMRISDVARILDLPIETLRFYERSNVVTPIRDETNNYRYYDAWDFLTIIDFITYRNMGFSVKEAAEALHMQEITEVMETVDRKITSLRQKLVYDQMLLDYLISWHRELSAAPYNYRMFWHEVLPEQKYIRFSREADEEYPDIVSGDQVLSKWLKAVPFTKGVKHISLDENYQILEGDRWSLMMDSSLSRYFDLPDNEEVCTIPERMYLTTYIDAGSRGEFSLSLLDPMLSWLQQNHIRVIGDILCFILAKGRKGDHYFRCIKVCAPVEPSEQ